MKRPSAYRELRNKGDKVYRYIGGGVYRHVATIRCRLPPVAYNQPYFDAQFPFLSPEKQSQTARPLDTPEPLRTYRFRWQRFRVHRIGDKQEAGVLRDILTTTDDVSQIDSPDFELTNWGDTLEGQHA